MKCRRVNKTMQKASQGLPGLPTGPFCLALTRENITGIASSIDIADAVPFVIDIRKVYDCTIKIKNACKKFAFDSDFPRFAENLGKCAIEYNMQYTFHDETGEKIVGEIEEFHYAEFSFQEPTMRGELAISNDEEGDDEEGDFDVSSVYFYFSGFSVKTNSIFNSTFRILRVNRMTDPRTMITEITLLKHACAFFYSSLGGEVHFYYPLVERILSCI